MPTYFISNIANVLKITNTETATDFVIRPVCTLLKLVGILKKAVHGMDHSIEESTHLQSLLVLV